jgi:hypothetical protein
MQTGIKERRQSPRENLSEPVRIRPCDPRSPEEVCPTLNVSRNGLYFMTATQHYVLGMNVFVTLNYRADDETHREQIGDVVRSQKLGSGNWGVAIRILIHNNPGVYSGT